MASKKGIITAALVVGLAAASVVNYVKTHITLPTPFGSFPIQRNFFGGETYSCSSGLIDNGIFQTVTYRESGVDSYGFTVVHSKGGNITKLVEKDFVFARRILKILVPDGAETIEVYSTAWYNGPYAPVFGLAKRVDDSRVYQTCGATTSKDGSARFYSSDGIDGVCLETIANVFDFKLSSPITTSFDPRLGLFYTLSREAKSIEELPREAVDLMQTVGTKLGSYEDQFYSLIQ